MSVPETSLETSFPEVCGGTARGLSRVEMGKQALRILDPGLPDPAGNFGLSIGAKSAHGPLPSSPLLPATWELSCLCGS